MVFPSIESTRLHVSLAVRQLIGSDILGSIPATEIDETDIFGRDTMVLRSVRIGTFAGVGRSLPIVLPLMILSTLTTVAVLSGMSMSVTPMHATTDSVLFARLPRAGSMQSHPPMTPLQARVQRLQKEHAEMMHGAASSEQSVSSSSMSDASSSLSSEAAPASSASSAPTKPPVALKRADNKAGVYLTANSIARTQFFESTVTDLLAAKGTAIVFDVKGGNVLFHSAAPMANELKLVKPLYELPDIIRQLHEKDIYVIGRFVAIKDAGFTGKRPDTKIRHPKTGKVLTETWVDPANDDAIEYNMQVVCELAAAGIDEINLDYIRFSTAEFGALGAYSGEEKAERVEKFIKATRETIDRCGPATKLGLSTFAILGWDYDINVETLGQDVIRFAPLVDIISPMAYPATFTSPGYYVPGRNPGPRNYYLVYRTLKGYTDMLGPDHAHKIRPWIQGYGVTTKDMQDQIRGVYDAGYCGFTVWSAGNHYSPTFAAMKKDTIRPEKCTEAQAVAAEEPVID